MKLKNILLLSSALMLVIGVTACQRHRSFEGRSKWIASKISDELDLNKDQETKLEAVRQEFLAARNRHKDERAKNIEEVKQIVLSEKLDAAKVKEKLAHRQKFFDENFDTVFAKVSVFHAALNSEQKQKAVELIGKFAE